MMNINNKADYSEEKMTLEEKLKSMKNYDKWLYFLENFDELKYIKNDDNEGWNEFSKFTKEKMLKSLELIFSAKKNSDSYFDNFDKLLPVLVEKDQNKKLHKFFEFFLSFPESSDWEKQVYNMFAAIDFRFNMFYEYLPHSSIAYSILSRIGELEEDWVRVIGYNWEDYVFWYWWQIRKTIQELNEIDTPTDKQYWEIFWKNMPTLKQWNETDWDKY